MTKDIFPKTTQTVMGFISVLPDLPQFFQISENTKFPNTTKKGLIMKKTISIVLIIASLLLIFASCTPSETVYKTDVKAYSIYSTITKLLKNNSDTYVYALETKGFEELGEKYQGTTHIKYTIGIDVALISDCFVETKGGNGCFEYGVFKASSAENIQSVKTALEAYITRLKNDELGLSYSPDDKLILDKASVHVFGDYVLFVIVPDDDAATIKTRTENMLTAE